MVRGSLFQGEFDFELFFGFAALRATWFCGFSFF
jgi:hypothetical protein